MIFYRGCRVSPKLFFFGCMIFYRGCRVSPKLFLCYFSIEILWPPPLSGYDRALVRQGASLDLKETYYHYKETY